MVLAIAQDNLGSNDLIPSLSDNIKKYALGKRPLE